MGPKMPILPVEAYLSQDWFDREQQEIFSKTWRFAGFAEDLTEPGQYLTVQAGLNNLFIVMGRDRRLRAFHNICRHRGTQLLRAVGKTRHAITCPYHDWTYDLAGRLISVPEQEREFPDLDRGCLGLHPASVDRWRGMLFVHPSAEAPSIVEWFGDVEPHLGPHRPDELIEYEDGYSRHEIAANWKIVVENYIDAYHLAHLHSGTLAMYDHTKIKSSFYGPHFAFYEPLAPHYAKDLEKNAPSPLIDHIPQEHLGTWVPMLFPSLGLGESECSWSTFHIIPISPEKSVVEIRTKVPNVSEWQFTLQSWRSASFWSQHLRGKYEGNAEMDPMASGDFMAEDIYACEQQQKSLKSPYFSIGASAEQGEAAVRTFQQLVSDWVEGGFRNRIHVESPDVEDVVSEAELKGVDSVATVTLDGETTTVDIPQGSTVLEALRDAGLNPPYSCQAGVCGTCRARLKQGEVHLRARVALEDPEIDAGAILTCQALPLTATLELTYDL